MSPSAKPLLFYGYLRVSSKSQGKRRGKINEDLTLSQETQLEIIKRYVHSKGGKLVGYETEIESGTHADRSALRRSVNNCRINDYVLITAYLDRLHRNVEAMSQFLNSKIDFVFCDFPDASKLTIHIMSALAEYQSDQTRSKINATIERKRSLSSDRKIPTHKNSQQALEDNRDVKKAQLAKQDKAYWNESNIQAGDLIVDKRNVGWTYQRIADHINNKGWTTRTGKGFSAMTVKLLYERYSSIPIEYQLKHRAASVSMIRI